jgi:DNA repair protein RadD
MTLRPYQQHALALARQAYRDGARKVLLVAPTGSGKTVIAAAAIDAATAKGRRVLVVAPRREIVAQTSARLAAHGIIAAGQRNPDPSAPVQLGMAQTIRRRLDTITAPDLVIVDEAHLDEWTDLLTAFPSAHYLLLTATPLRSSNRSWRGAADALVEVETVAGLVAAGHLVEPQVWSAETPDLTGIRRAASGELSPKQAGAAFSVSAILGDTVEQIRRHCQGLRTLVFASSVKHSQALAASLPRAAHVDGTTPGPERARILAALAAHELDTVCKLRRLVRGSGRAERRRCRRRPRYAVGSPVAPDGRTRTATLRRQARLRSHRPRRQRLPSRPPDGAARLDPRRHRPPRRRACCVLPDVR